MTPYQLERHLQNIKRPRLLYCLILIQTSLLAVLLFSRQGPDHQATRRDDKGNYSYPDGDIARPACLHSQTTSASTSRSQSSPFQKLRQQHQILLVTQGRSGSSFTGNLISHDSGIFYVYEPLFTLRDIKPSYKTDVLQLLETILTCNFQPSDVSFLDNVMYRNRGSELNRFYSCTKSNLSGLRHIECFLKLIEECRQKKTVFIKTIRLSMSLAKDLMLRMPNLKVLYLIRDPRAVLRSQARVFQTFKWPQDVASRAKSHCKRLTNDMAAIDKISDLFPGRIRLIRYESGAMDPVGYTRDIYKFVNLDFTDDTLAYVEAVTQGKGPKKLLNGPFGLVRSNSTETANQWRSKVQYENVKSIDEVCTEVYSRFGYKKVTSNEHLNSNDLLFEHTFKQDV